MNVEQEKIYLTEEDDFSTEAKSKLNNITTNEYYEDLKLFIRIIISICNFLLDRKKSFLVAGFATALTSIVLLLLIPNYYTAKTGFIPPPPTFLMAYSAEINTLTEGLPSFPNLASSFSGISPNQIYIGLIQGRTVNEEIIKKFKLQERYNLITLDQTIEKLVGSILEVVEENSILYIKITESDPVLAADIANEYINQLSLLMNKVNVNNVKNQKIFLEERLKNIDKDLQTASSKLTTFQTKNKMVLVDKQGEAIISEIAVLRTQIISTETQLESLKTIYTNNNSKIKMLQSELAELKNKLNKLTGAKSITNGNDLNAINLLEIPSMTVDFGTLSRDVKILEQVYILLTKEYELAKIKEAKETISLKVVEEASVPTKKSWPSRTIYLIIILTVVMIIVLITELCRYMVNIIKNTDTETFIMLSDLNSRIKNDLFFRKSKAHNN